MTEWKLVAIGVGIAVGVALVETSVFLLIFNVADGMVHL